VVMVIFFFFFQMTVLALTKWSSCDVSRSKRLLIPSKCL
jgi:hypothetical protein